MYSILAMICIKMKKTLTVVGIVLSILTSFSQEKNLDTLQTIHLNEVIIIGNKSKLAQKQSKPLSTIDEYLQKSSKITMIKRGAYAWEPTINSMSAERTLVTIEGMRIFGACTDKMDPITSYIEVSNLSEATICSGQEGACFGTTIGGAIDLKRNEGVFGYKKWNFDINSGFETNNSQKILGLGVNYTSKKLYTTTNFMLRDASNYFDGKNNEVLFSQFKKINFSGKIGYKITEKTILESDVIYDKATNVGYPALPMDVAVAEALIASVKIDYNPKNKVVKNWQTKLYYNTVNHKMDDTKRPFVPIHMDMPGWSTTAGYYSKINFVTGKHTFIINANSFNNTSLAEMTMYPNNPTESVMFMYTWPNVVTFYSGIFAEDNFAINCHSALKITASLGRHQNKVANNFGLESLQIFYPEMKAQNSRFLKSFAANYSIKNNHFQYAIGTGYAQRAPSVTEGYGFYLFNSFENFDNVGNPNLKNENAIENNLSISYKNQKLSIKTTANCFLFSNYIIAKPNAQLVPMTIGARGVKVYSSLEKAFVFNSTFFAEYIFSKYLKTNVQIGYSLGKDSQKTNLPFISPLNYQVFLGYNKGKYYADFVVNGNGVQTNYSSYYGEDKTPDYVIFNTAFGYNFKINTGKIATKLGVENILNTYYSTFSDWNNIPRMGRNIYINLSCNL